MGGARSPGNSRDFIASLIPLPCCGAGLCALPAAAVPALLVPVWGTGGTGRDRGDRRGQFSLQSPVCAVPCRHRAEVLQLERGALVDFHPQQVGEGSVRGPGCHCWPGCTRDGVGTVPALSNVSGSEQRVWEACNGASGDAWGREGQPDHPGTARCLSSPGDRAGSARSSQGHPQAVTGRDPSVSPGQGRDSTSLSYLGADFHHRNPEQCSQRAGGGGQGQRVGAGMG